MKSWLVEYWERALFAIVGLICLAFSFDFLWHGKVPEASAVFAVAFFSFLYSNVSRFKRFKGLGFEAELWEDKQKEAADLIERLKSVVTIYSREIVMGSVLRMRFGGSRWKHSWNLLEELHKQHTDLGQNIDFADLKTEMDDYFLYDMVSYPERKLYSALMSAHSKAHDIINHEFPGGVTDIDAYNIRIAQLNEIKYSREDRDIHGPNVNLAEDALSHYEDQRKKLKENFGINFEIDEPTVTRLIAISKLYRNRPIAVTETLIAWAEKDE